MKSLRDNCQIKLMAFDLDGTLLDSVPDIAQAVAHTMAELKLPAREQEQVRGWIGSGAQLLIKRALSGDIKGDVPDDVFEKAYPVFLKYYAEFLNKDSVIYEGVISTLAAFKASGIKLACITNKPSQFTVPLLDDIGLSQYFDKVACGDTYAQRKPHPMPLLEVAEFFSVSPEQSIMVGDSVNDIKAAQAAGFYSICVDYGYHGDYDVHQLGADVVISHFSQINQLLQQAA
ncbi:MAG: phosphoglycolate phosphatase [Cycloclasticus sp.]